MKRYLSFLTSHLSTSRGFTLVELLVVIGIMGVLAATAFFALNPRTQFAKARDAQRKNDLEQIKNALDAYYSDNNSYPSSVSGKINEAELDESYLQKIPTDPLSTPSNVINYSYAPVDGSGNSCTTSPCNSYRLYANLERCSDVQGSVGVDCHRTGSNYRNSGNYSVNPSNLAALSPIPSCADLGGTCYTGSVVTKAFWKCSGLNPPKNTQISFSSIYDCNNKSTMCCK